MEPPPPTESPAIVNVTPQTPHPAVPEKAPSTSSTTSHQPTAQQQQEEEEDEEEHVVSISDFSRMIVAILIPVCITMLSVVILVRALNVQSGNANIGTLVYHEDSSDSTGTKIWGSLINALIFLAVILVTTVIMVLLYYFRCIKFMIAWLVLSTVLLLGTIGGYFVMQILAALNWSLDWISMCLYMLNFAGAGVVAVFWQAPAWINRVYLIIISVLVATYFTQLSEWTTWAILIMIACYDLFAVLCPKGPLKVLVELAQTRKEPIPALLYNGSVLFTMFMADTQTEVPATTPPKIGAPQPQQQQAQVGARLPPIGDEEEEERRGVKLGLGDFVFYSVLMGRAAMYDILTVVTCFVAIITGLFGTLLLLGIFKRALPALPISIALGVVFYFLTRVFLMPYIVCIALTQTFI